MMASFSTKLPWVLCTIFSFVYFYLFSQDSNNNASHDFDNESGLMGGFCVWGKPTPTSDNGCTNNTNSHMYSWYEDLCMTMIVAAAYVYGSRKDTTLHIALGGIIFFHGLLHYVLSTRLRCLTNVDDPRLEDLGWFLYMLFTFFLSVIIFGIGFLEQYGPKAVLLASGVVTFITYRIAIGSGGTEWLLSALFATSHPIGSFTGLFTNSPVFTNFMGWIFLVATVDGIVELRWCQTFLKPLGGHIWYDIFLHAAVIAALPVFREATKAKKN
jgi:hypothetical protein